MEDLRLRGRDRWELRMDIRMLCYEVAYALADGRKLSNLRPRPLPDDLKAARLALIRTLGEGNWSGGTWDRDIREPSIMKMYEILANITSQSHTLGAAWGAVLELFESKAAKCFVRPPRLPGFGLLFLPTLEEIEAIPKIERELVILAAVKGVLHFRIFDGDGKMVVTADENGLEDWASQIVDLKRQLENLGLPPRMTMDDKEAIVKAVTTICGHTPSAVRPSLDLDEGWPLVSLKPETVDQLSKTYVNKEKPHWNRNDKILRYKDMVCRAFKRHAASQFEILDAFESAGWPQSVPLKTIISRQASQDLNSSMEPGSPIRFGFSELTKTVCWSLTG